MPCLWIFLLLAAGDMMYVHTPTHHAPTHHAPTHHARGMSWLAVTLAARIGRPWRAKRYMYHSALLIHTSFSVTVALGRMGSVVGIVWVQCASAKLQVPVR